MKPEFEQILTRLSAARSRLAEARVAELKVRIDAEHQAWSSYFDGLNDALHAVEELCDNCSDNQKEDTH